MTTKAKPSPAALLRKIARLEAQIEELKTQLNRNSAATSAWLCKAVDRQLLIEQAIAVLQGRDA